MLSFDHDLSDEVLTRLSRTPKTARKESIKLIRSISPTVDRSKFEGLINEHTVLKASAFLFTNIWLRNLLDRVTHPDLPQISNTDGEPLEFQSVHYPLLSGTTQQAVRAALASVPELNEENEHFWNWVDAKPRKGASPTKASKGRTFITAMKDGRIVLGNLELKERTLTLSVNSRARAERGRALIDRVLTGLVREPLVEAQTVKQMMTSRADARPKVSSGLSPEDERAFVHKTLDDHYTRMLGEPVPALGNATPVKAVETANGREKVIAWLKTLENHSAKMPDDDPMATYNFTWLWQRLGLADQRW